MKPIAYAWTSRDSDSGKSIWFIHDGVLRGYDPRTGEFFPSKGWDYPEDMIIAEMDKNGYVRCEVPRAIAALVYDPDMMVPDGL